MFGVCLVLGLFWSGSFCGYYGCLLFAYDIYICMYVCVCVCVYRECRCRCAFGIFDLLTL